MHFPVLPAPHYRANGGRIITQIRDALSYRWGMHYRTDGGRIIVQMGDALSYKWGTLLLCKAEGNKPRGTSVASGAEPL